MAVMQAHVQIRKPSQSLSYFTMMPRREKRRRKQQQQVVNKNRKARVAFVCYPWASDDHVHIRKTLPAALFASFLNDRQEKVVWEDRDAWRKLVSPSPASVGHRSHQGFQGDSKLRIR